MRLMKPILYGIANCDTVKKARAWLAAREISCTFHDYKKLGVDATTLNRWIDAVGWEPLINRGGTTFRKLPRISIVHIDRIQAVELMMMQPSLIKRPIVEAAQLVLVGFKPADWAARLPA